MTEWRVIPSFRDYEASSDGEVRRVRPGARQTAVQPLKPFKEKNGYPTVTLWVDGRTNSQWLHRLVCEAFHGIAPFQDAQVAHDDGVPGNCSAINLSWKTAVENAHDKRRHGTENIGQRNGMAKMTEENVSDIRRLYSALPRSSGGKRVRKGAIDTLAAEFGITKSGIYQITTGRNWSHSNEQ